MLRTFKSRAAFLLAVVLCGRAALAIPSDDLLNSLTPTADVNDFAHLLSPAENESLEARCRELRAKTGAQLTVVTLQSLRGGEIEDFANKLFARWKVGQRGKDNGLLLLVAMDERQSRLEVGYGLEPIIPDVLAGRILDHKLRPKFRQQQYAAGLADAIDEISTLVEKGEPADRAALDNVSEQTFGELFVRVMFLALFVAVGGFLLGFGFGNKQAGTILLGAMFAGMPMFIALTAAGILSLLIHIPVAITLAILGWNQAKAVNRPGNRTLRRTVYSPEVWTWGDSSGSSGGWHSGGGGFSQGWGGFGGGSSGGGGASSSW